MAMAEEPPPLLINFSVTHLYFLVEMSCLRKACGRRRVDGVNNGKVYSKYGIT